jgi:hypothetical protein
MKFLIGGVWILVCVSFLLAMLSGRIKLRSCCGATDAACDLRLMDRVSDDLQRVVPPVEVGPAPTDGSFR